jgi:hypothetical protein
MLTAYHAYKRGNGRQVLRYLGVFAFRPFRGTATRHDHDAVSALSSYSIATCDAYCGFAYSNCSVIFILTEAKLVDVVAVGSQRCLGHFRST